MPRKTFTAGDVLAAADVNNFLMDQSVMTFADSDARGSAIPTPSEGMLTYLDDTNALEVFDGADFTAVGGGGGASGLTHITTVTGNAVTSISVDDVFSATHKNYRILISASLGSSAAARLRMRVAGADNTASTHFSAYAGRSADGAVTLNENSGTSGLLSRTVASPFKFNFDISDPFLSLKTMFTGQTYTDQAADQLAGGFVHATSSSFTGFTLFASTGNLNDTTIQVFGYED